MTSRSRVLLSFARNYARPPRHWKEDAVKYGHVTYYPRDKKEAEAPITPSKLFMVNRVKPFKGNPYWEKNILQELGFLERKNNTVIVKNTPELCALLWKVKHLVNIVPIKLPEKLPDLDDTNGTFLHENGTFQVTPKIDPIRYETALQEQRSIKRLPKTVVSEKLRLQWVKGSLIR